MQSILCFRVRIVQVVAVAVPVDVAIIVPYRGIDLIRFDSFSFYKSFTCCCNKINERRGGRRSVRLMRYFRNVVVAAAAVALTVLACFTGM